MVLQGFHSGREVRVVGGPCDGKMELEIRILPMRLAIGRVSHEFESLTDR